MLKNLYRNFGKNTLDILLIVVGSISWILTMIKSGLTYDYGVGFWGPNGHDGIWHIAVSQSLAKGTQEIPIFAGEPLQNYHLGFDVLLAALHRITFLPIDLLYFQILPILFALSIGYLVFRFVYYWKNSRSAARWATFFLYYGGSLGYVITLLRDGKLGGESIFWSQQSVSTLINPPFALSLVLIFAGLIFLLSGFREKNLKSLIAATFFFGILVQVKIYAGILVLGGLFVSALFNSFKNRDFKLLKVFAGSLIISVLIFPASKDLSGSLVLRPFWFIDSMLAATDRLYWPKMSEAIMNYGYAGNYLKLALAYIITYPLFVIGNFGTRLLSIGWLTINTVNLKKSTGMNIFFSSIIIVGILIPTIFIQTGTPWNTIQFLYYSLIFSGIMAGVKVSEFLTGLKSLRVRIFTALIIIILTLPTTVSTLYNNYLPGRPPAMVSTEELKALAFLKEQPSGTVLSSSFDKDMALNAISNPPRPLYLYESTAYVSAYTSKTTFLEDTVNLEITGYPWKERQRMVDRFFEDGEMQLLRDNGIKYLYLTKPYKLNFLLSPNLNMIFTNSAADIYKVE